MSAYRGQFISHISEQKNFLENWEEFRKLDLLYVPIGDGNYLAVDPANPEELNDFIDVASTKSPDGLDVAFVVTDPSLVPVDLALAKLPSREALFRLFKNPHLDGVVLNPPVSDAPVSTSQGFTLFSYAIPRLIGLIDSSDYLARDTGHLEQSYKFISTDHICKAMYHAAQARDEGESFDHSFLLEATALMRLGLVDQATSYLEWFRLNRGGISAASLVDAQISLINGQAVHALELLDSVDQSILETVELREIQQVERARALYQLDQLDEALSCFEEVFQANPESVEAKLGIGVVTRAMFYDPIAKNKLEEAIEHFEFVTQHGHYHKPEALHHLGTVLSALERWEEAEEAYRETLSLAPSPVSKRNLCLALHAQDKQDEACLHYYYLKEHFPEYVIGLEPHFETAASHELLVPNPEDLQHDLEAAVLSSRSQIETEFDIPFQNDIMDFKRFDDYINFHAPGGVFLDECCFFEQEWHVVESALCAVAFHLADLLVQKGYATWAYDQNEELHMTMIRMHTEYGSDEPLSIFGNVLRKFQAGAVNDNLTNLETIVALVPEYQALTTSYTKSFQTQPCTQNECRDLEEQADRTVSTLRKAGFLLCEDISDLGMLDAALSSLRDPHSLLLDSCNDEKQTAELLNGIGYYFGMLFQKYAGGTWFSHQDPLGVSIQESSLPDVFPIWLVYKRAEQGSSPGVFETLSNFHSPLVCARLTRKLEAHEIGTRQELSTLLAEQLPKIMKEDPTGSSLGRMVDMISLQALGKVLE